MQKSVVLFHIRIFPDPCQLYSAHEPQVHGSYCMYVTSGLLSWSSGSTSVAHFNPGSNTHFGMRIYVCSYCIYSYQDSFIYKNSLLAIYMLRIDYRGVLNYHGLQGFTTDCRCTHSISLFYIIIMKCAQNLNFW